MRDEARLHLARLAFRPACAVDGPRAPDPLLVAHRRALLGLLRARCREGIGCAGRRDVHIRHRGANLAPAVIEAHEARVPMIVLTADRPPELRDVGAGQTIDQLKLYGDAAKWFFEVGVYDASPDRLRWIRAWPAGPMRPLSAVGKVPCT